MRALKKLRSHEQNKVLAVPKVGDRWVHLGCKRAATITAIAGDTVASMTVSYRYAQGLNGGGLWRRQLNPVQTISVSDWLDHFTPEPKKGSKKR